MSKNKYDHFWEKLRKRSDFDELIATLTSRPSLMLLATIATHPLMEVTPKIKSDHEILPLSLKRKCTELDM